MSDMDVDALGEWLRNKARIHESVLSKTLTTLQEEEVFEVQDLRFLRQTHGLDKFFKSVTAAKISAALDALGELSLADEPVPDKDLQPAVQAMATDEAPQEAAAEVALTLPHNKFNKQQAAVDATTRGGPAAPVAGCAASQSCEGHSQTPHGDVQPPGNQATRDASAPRGAAEPRTACKEQSTANKQQVTDATTRGGPAAPVAGCAASESREGHSQTPHGGNHTPGNQATRDASTPRGAAALRTAYGGEPPAGSSGAPATPMEPPAPRGFLRINMPTRDHKFKLRAGGLPDAHLPWAFRLGRARYKTLELYDLWVKGGKLEADPFFYEDAVETGEDIDDRCPASRVARLLNTVLPEGFVGTFSDADSFDTRHSAVSQHATFARHGWPTAPPTAGQLMMRMVRYAENDCNLENIRYPHVEARHLLPRASSTSTTTAMRNRTLTDKTLTTATCPLRKNGWTVSSMAMPRTPLRRMRVMPRGVRPGLEPVAPPPSLCRARTAPDPFSVPPGARCLSVCWRAPDNLTL